MKVLSVNISQPENILWRGREVTTGIFKRPANRAVFLGQTGLKGDHVHDKRFHGDSDKACYLYGYNHYDYWKSLYPHLDWEYGMFGENLTVDRCDERNIFVGSVYQIGRAMVQVVQPRQPCFKLGVRFNDQKILKDFIRSGHSGIYLKVLKEGDIKSGDVLRLHQEDSEQISILDLFRAVYHQQDNRMVLDRIDAHEVIPQSLKDDIKRIV